MLKIEPLQGVKKSCQKSHVQWPVLYIGNPLFRVHRFRSNIKSVGKIANSMDLKLFTLLNTKEPVVSFKIEWSVVNPWSLSQANIKERVLCSGYHVGWRKKCQIKVKWKCFWWIAWVLFGLRNAFFETHKKRHQKMCTKLHPNSIAKLQEFIAKRQKHLNAA